MYLVTFDIKAEKAVPHFEPAGCCIRLHRYLVSGKVSKLYKTTYRKLKCIGKW